MKAQREGNILNSSKINFGTTMIIVHNSITRGLDVTIGRSAAFVQAGYPDSATREGFAIYVRTLGWVMNAHHMGEDHVVFPYLKSKLPDVPFDELFSEHRQMDKVLKELQMSVEAVVTNAQNIESLNALNRSATRLAELWHPHITKEQSYIYDAKNINAVLDMDEQIKLGDETAKHSQLQADPGFMIPFVLYNLSLEERAYMAQTMPPAVIQELLPGPWQEKWKPMKPFFLD